MAAAILLRTRKAKKALGMDGIDDIVKEFIVESTESLDRLDRDLICLENDPCSKELLASVFRAIHTIKGTTGFLGFSKLEAVAHAGENLLSRLRDGVLILSPNITSGLLAMVDAIRAMLTSIEDSGSDGDRDDSSLIETLNQLQDPEIAAKRPGPPVAEREMPDAGEVPFGQLLLQSGLVGEGELANALDQQKKGDPRRVGEILVAQGAVHPDEVLSALETQQGIRSSSVSNNNIRVEVSQLDRLMNLVEELVIAHNQILQFSTTQQDSTFLNATRRLSLITTELQEGVMKIRMQPIEYIWGKFPRAVRDLALVCGKQVRIEMEGNDTKLDKTILEAINDPLTHLVRNAIDHGIETPAKRKAAGKPAVGHLLLRAYQEGSQVNLEVSDDGAGINLTAVKHKAVERGLIRQEQAARMSEREAYQLIFLPGLSTAANVTNVSGRGVGMDVVRTNIEKIGGVVDVQSSPGAGTRVRIEIPQRWKGKNARADSRRFQDPADDSSQNPDTAWICPA